MAVRNWDVTGIEKGERNIRSRRVKHNGEESQITELILIGEDRVKRN